MILSKQKIGIVLIFLCGVISLVVLVNTGPIPQDPLYHQFSDNRSISGIPNVLNVLSNIPFFAVGILGIYKLSRQKVLNIVKENMYAYLIFFSALVLVSLGSGYYHLFPNNKTLVLDRLPMAIAFMSLASIIIGEFISVNPGKYLLFPLQMLGLISVLYWHYTETNGAGDLRIYAFIQYFSILVIPISLLFFTAKFTQKGSYWLLIGSYALAKLFECYDQSIHSILIIISGHSLKHIIAAGGLYLLLKSYENRKNI